MIITFCTLIPSGAQDFELIPYRVKDKWVYHDDKNGIYIKPKYNEVQQFKNGYLLITDSKGKKGYINTKGVEFFK